MTLTKRAIICDRVSSDDQRDKGGRKERLKAMREYCIRLGHPIADEIVDEITGIVPIRERKNGRRIYGHIQRHTCELIVWFDVDRVARDDDGLEYIQLRRACREAGIELHFAKTGKSDLDNPYGGLTDYFKALGAAEERKKIAERTHFGRVNAVCEGHTPTWGQAVYGFRRMKTGNKGETVTTAIDAHEAAIIRRARDHILGKNGIEQMSSMALCAMFDREGVPVPSQARRKRGKRKHACWHPASLRGILRNRALIGEWHYAGQAVRRPDLAILIEADFDAIDAQIRANWSNGDGAKKRDYLMSRRMKCSCGAGLSGIATKIRGREYLYYICVDQKIAPRHCTCREQRMRAAEVDAQAWQWFLDLINNQDMLRAGVRRRIEREAQQTQPRRDRAAELQRNLDTEKAELGKLAKQLRDLDGPAAESVKAEMRESNRRIQTWTNERDGILKALASEKPGIDEAAVLRQVDEVRAKAHKAGFATRRFIIKRFDVRGQIERESGKSGSNDAKQVRYTCGLIEATNAANKEASTSRCFC
jgi:DNA invertase Pin-like site-specific DNA recombinase